MKATDILKQEHELILVMLQILDAACAKMEEGETVNREHLAAMVDFIRNFADRCHHAKEEKLLFPALRESGIGRENGPIGVMLAEHAEGRFFAKGMGEALEEIRAGDSVAAGRFIGDAGGYVKLIDGHIMKENNILFRMADERLSDSQQKELLKEFDRVEREEIGAGVHEKYHDMLHRLRDIYLAVKK
ncbi:MAG TPA: hemerythrin domain-containing protein [Spirochaetota bacterium]|nr:hemerythrin domain-containing protein [Spirochaetota bacterium]HRS78583.1 hemerythrin domain-containing protein [Spirochaetota bacterium]HRT76522.1 hemerythrin domain-containing protein [Spirochaetota bacterium]